MVRIWFLYILNLILPFLIIILISLRPSKTKEVSFIGSIIIFWIFLILWGLFKNYNLNEVYFLLFNFNLLGLNTFFIFGLDSISLNLLLLTSFIFVLSFYYSVYTVYFKFNLYSYLLFFLLFCLNIVFCIFNLFLFYIFFELSLIPVFFLITIWGSRSQRLKAAFLFFLYTATFSFLFLFSLFFIYNWIGSFDFIFIKYTIFNTYFLNSSKLNFISIMFFLTFIVKLPLVPFHIWLPEAHVEAPTVGSVLLASILLKLGAYGLIRFVLPFTSNIIFFWFSFFFGLGLISFFYSTLMAFTQVDLKKIIAYSSISHMSLVVLGLFSFSYNGLNGAWIMLIAHGFVSAALFFLVGMLYNRFNTRLIKYYSGLFIVIPKLSFFMFSFSLFNIGFPGSLNFISELLVFLSILPFTNYINVILVMLGFILTLLYSIWVYNRIFFGTFKISYFTCYYDLKTYEFNILFTLFCVVCFFGLFPNILFI